MKPQKAPCENAAIQKGTELFFNKPGDRTVAIPLSGEERFQFIRNDLIEHCRFRIARSICEADSHKSVASRKSAHNSRLNILNNMRSQRLNKSVARATTLSRLSRGCRLLSAGSARLRKMPEENHHRRWQQHTGVLHDYAERTGIIDGPIELVMVTHGD